MRRHSTGRSLKFSFSRVHSKWPRSFSFLSIFSSYSVVAFALPHIRWCWRKFRFRRWHVFLFFIFAPAMNLDSMLTMSLFVSHRTDERLCHHRVLIVIVFCFRCCHILDVSKRRWHDNEFDDLMEPIQDSFLLTHFKMRMSFSHL